MSLRATCGIQLNASTDRKQTTHRSEPFAQSGALAHRRRPSATHGQLARELAIYNFVWNFSKLIAIARMVIALSCDAFILRAINRIIPLELD